MGQTFLKRPSEAYRQLIGLGEIDEDSAQLKVLTQLDRLWADLLALPSRKSGLAWVFKTKPKKPPGLYLWGSVGRGKTMLMDLMLETAPLSKKKRLHFQSFMADIHARIHVFRQDVKAGKIKDADPLPLVAQELAHEITLLCLDEFSVSDIADAMILTRLFSALFANGVVLVATSNIGPDDLYRDGLNRALFLPFIDLLKNEVEVVELDALVDYRLEKLGGDQTYFIPDDEQAAKALDHITARHAVGPLINNSALDVLGHQLLIPKSASNIARFDYTDLCKKALGANDFIAIAEKYPIVVIDHIPIILPENREEAKRFIALIDAFYDRSVKLYLSAAVSPDKLYQASDGREAFEFDRTISRLIEMQSMSYRDLPHGRRAATAMNERLSNGPSHE